jgi:hypothetical protein
MAVRLEMRVDMRRWALVLCFIGVMGGGCSARSLLTIELSTNDGTAVMGTPLIKVTAAEETVRTVENDTIIVLGEGSSTTVGVYLDGDVSGPVAVQATLRADGCNWSGQSKAVQLRTGARTEVAVKLTKEGCAGPRPDAGADSADGGDDGRPTLVADGGDAPAGVSREECIAYCATYVQRCADWLPPRYGQLNCVAPCLAWPRGNGAPDAHEDSLSCRQYYLRLTENPDARNLCAMCPLASPESEACGGPPAPPNACLGDAAADGD